MPIAISSSIDLGLIKCGKIFAISSEGIEIAIELSRRRINMDLQSTLGSSEQFFKTFFKSMTDDMQMCIQNCIQCSQVCEQMVQHCLKKGGPHSEPGHIRLLQDCTEICQTSAHFMIRESSYHTQTCQVCADICLACATDCERLGDDDMMKMCADVCKRCAQTCQKMSARH